MAAVAAHFGRDVDRTLAKLPGILEDARGRGVDLLVLPDATIGGYLLDLHHPVEEGDGIPHSVEIDGPEVAAIVALAGDMTVCFGIAERAVDGGEERRYNTAVCVNGDGVLGVVIACLSAWPASVTDRSDRIRNDRQAHLFDLYDCARAAENQVYLVSSNQTGVLGGLRFLGQAKVVDPAGEIVAKTWAKGGLAVAEADVSADVARARRSLNHLAQRAEHAYRLTAPA